MSAEQVIVNKGLEGIYFDNTSICHIDGQRGILLYRGYNIHDLASNATYEEVCYLLLYDRLPTKDELDQFDAALKENRNLPSAVMDVIYAFKDGHPTDVLRTAVSALGTIDPDVKDMSLEANLRKGIRLIAQFPTIVAAHERIRKGLDFTPPREDLSHAANFLWMLKGEEPDPDAVRAMDLDFILHAEHSSNASTFTARVAASTLADLHSSVVAAISALKGPLHGGAAEAVMEMVEAIGEPERAEGWVQEQLAAKKRIMGFGHRVYKTEDPRARHLRELSKILGEKYGEPKTFQILQNIEKAMEPMRAKGIYVNVDFYAGSIYHYLGIPADLYIPIFAIGRIVGWVAHILEQYSDNRLIRPLLHYVGPMERQWVFIEQRS
ncbi:MAG: citrate synthase [Armatimonadetes bacterium]|nr:citrate synthase [Armatimonadota bacterium]MDW8028425.1 citrate synthase [Armatimonadota bacterium]